MSRLRFCGFVLLVVFVWFAAVAFSFADAAEVLSGELSVDMVMHYDFNLQRITNFTHEIRLKTDSGEMVDLEIEGTEKETLLAKGPHSRVQLSGSRSQKGFRAVEHIENDKAHSKNEVSASNDEKRQSTWQIPVSRTAVGDFNVLFFLINVIGNDTRLRWPSDSMPVGLNDSFERIRQHFYRSSWGQMNLVSKKRDGSFAFYGGIEVVAPPLNTSDVCPSPWRINVSNIAQAKLVDDTWWNGTDYAGRVMRVFLYPTDLWSIYCRGVSVANWGHPGGVWAVYREDFLSHEMGHNLGMWHAGLQNASNSFDLEYGDGSDIMGRLQFPENYTGFGGAHHVAPHKACVGWTRSREAVFTTTGPSTTVIPLAPLSFLNTTSKQVVQLGASNMYTSLYPGLGSHFISYRVRNLSPSILDNVTDQYVGVAVHAQIDYRSFLLAVLKHVNDSYEILYRPDFYARVTLKAITPTQANISLYYEPAGSKPVTTPLKFYPLATPARLVDTRFATRFNAGDTRCYYIAGYKNISYNARAIAASLTVLSSNTSGFATIFPWQNARPPTTTLSFTANQSISTSTTSTLGIYGAICIYSTTAAHYILDVSGYYAPTGAAGGLYYKPLTTSSRVIDTRNGSKAIYVIGAPIAADTALVRNMRVGGVASNAGAISMTVGMLPQGTTGWLAAYDAGIPDPGTIIGVPAKPDNLETGAEVKLNASGTLAIKSWSIPTHVVVDVHGYYAPTTGYGYIPLRTAVRLVDTRNGAAAFYNGSGVILKNTTRSFNLGGISYGGVTIPQNVSALVGTVTVVSPAAGGTLTAYAAGTARPAVTHLMYTTRISTISNGVQLRGSGTRCAVSFYTSAQIHLIFDVTGYYVAVPGVATSVSGDATSSDASFLIQKAETDAPSRNHMSNTVVAVIVVATVTAGVVLVVLVLAVVIVKRQQKQENAEYSLTDNEN